MKLGILLSMFPEVHETFILRELLELDRQGVAFEIFSLQRPRHAEHPPGAEALLDRTHYGDLCSREALSACVRALLCRPPQLLVTVARMVAGCWREPGRLCKNLAILPLTLHFGEVMRARGIHHTHGHWRNIPTSASWILHQVQGIPWSAAIHGENIFTRNPFLETKLADATFVAVCTGYSWRHLRERMHHSRPEDIHLNYHGLDRHVWEAAAAAEARAVQADGTDAAPAEQQTHPPVILSVGRLFAFKGFRYLLRAAARLAADGVDFELRIVGEGPQAGELEQLAESLGIGSRVVWLGRVPFAMVLEELERASVFALASIYMPDDHFDGIPNVLAEAMAFGKPVVSTRVSGIPELVEDGVSGLLVPEKDPEALASALRRVLTDPELAGRLGAAARPRVRSLFDQEANVAELVQLFHRYVEAPS